MPDALRQDRATLSRLSPARRGGHASRGPGGRTNWRGAGGGRGARGRGCVRSKSNAPSLKAVREALSLMVPRALHHAVPQ